MIISASRRTDIPAFYSPWFFRRLSEGEVMVRNPMNPSQVSRIPLNREVLDCIVFWTKNPKPMQPFLEQLKDYPYYILFTITPYGNDLEPMLPPKSQVIQTFQEFSRSIGKERMIWRYDPILLSAQMDENFHYRTFREMAKQLSGFTSQCIISFIDMYKKCVKHLQQFHLCPLDKEIMHRMVTTLHNLAQENHILLSTCAEPEDFSALGVPSSQCIDPEKVSCICGYSIHSKKDPYQRKSCGCIESIDIGAYNTCGHWCLYCYANSDPRAARNNLTGNIVESPLLYGQVQEGDKITFRKVYSLKPDQRTLF